MRSLGLAVAIGTALGISSFTVMATTTAQATTAANSNEIAELKAQLAMLQAKVDALEQRSKAHSNDAVGSTLDVVPATAANVAAEQQISAPKQTVNTTSIGGKMFFDITNRDVESSDTGKTDASGVGFDVKRFYLAVDHTFDEIWSANLTTDFTYNSVLGRSYVYVKKAYVQGKFDPAFKLRIGSAEMPWIPYAEGWYGFRYVEPTQTDRLGYANSADWGLHAAGDIGANKAFNYAASVVNGGGYKNPSRSKGVDVEARVGFLPIENMVVAVGGYSGKRGKVEETTLGSTNTAQRGDILLAYANERFRVGGEYFTATDWNQVLGLVHDKSDGHSFWASLAISDRISLFTRYDNVNLSKNLDKSAKDEYYNAGVQYDVINGFLLSLVYKHEQGDKSVTDPVLPPHLINVKSDEVGVFGEVKF